MISIFVSKARNNDKNELDCLWLPLEMKVAETNWFYAMKRVVLERKNFVIWTIYM